MGVVREAGSVPPSTEQTSGRPLDARSTSPRRPLRFSDDATGKRRPIAELTPTPFVVRVRRDGRTVIYGRAELTTDSMMIENFR
jgi:hypothetical protein